MYNYISGQCYEVEDAAINLSLENECSHSSPLCLRLLRAFVCKTKIMPVKTTKCSSPVMPLSARVLTSACGTHSALVSITACTSAGTRPAHLSDFADAVCAPSLLLPGKTTGHTKETSRESVCPVCRDLKRVSLPSM